jgi:oxygen-independent coproporphyrinogen-3 oxidase
VEEGTPFAAKAARGALTPPGDDVAADRYALLDARLLAAGMVHYEVSNYALPGEESRHNEGYWCWRCPEFSQSSPERISRSPMASCP